MFYAQIYRMGERSQNWSFRFNSKKVYADAVNLLNEVKEDRVSKYKYVWRWNRWVLETCTLSQIPKGERKYAKEAPICESPEDVLTRIENIHGFWDSHIQ